MPKAKIGKIELEYDTFGDPSSKPLLLVMGFSVQMIRWIDEMCELCASKGFYVIRFDNRDVGLSTKLEEEGMPNMGAIVNALQKGKKPKVPYTIDDMADDAIGLLDALNIDKAHICGASMGGMIVLNMAFRYPNRILSLTSIMSTTGNPKLPPAKPEILQLLYQPIPLEREAYIEETVKRRRLIYGSGFPYDEALSRELATREYDRCHDREGVFRQLSAILANGNRRSEIETIKVPTLVIHGRDDPLVPVEGGIDTADAIPGAELLIIDGMGHDIPREVWSKVLDAIIENTEKA